MNILQDAHGRSLHKLRISLLDTCNFRCVYCMPDQYHFSKLKGLLTSEQIYDIAKNLVDFGVREIRLSGGEPSLRPDLRDIVNKLSQLPLSKLGLTTNGSKLLALLPFLETTECQYLNISLDSLNARTFENMTHTYDFEQTLSAVLAAKERGFSVKINVVLLRGWNDSEVLDFVDFSARHQIEVRFLELMKIGVGIELYEKHFISADEIVQKIKKKRNLTPVSVALDSTSFNFKSDCGAQIGFIASESRPFCEGCSRLRLSSKGVLRSCLMSEYGLDLKDKDSTAYPEILRKVVAAKPMTRIAEIYQPMYQIGG